MESCPPGNDFLVIVLLEANTPLSRIFVDNLSDRTEVSRNNGKILSLEKVSTICPVGWITRMGHGSSDTKYPIMLTILSVAPNLCGLHKDYRLDFMVRDAIHYLFQIRSS